MSARQRLLPQEFASLFILRRLNRIASFTVFPECLCWTAPNAVQQLHSSLIRTVLLESSIARCDDSIQHCHRTAIGAEPVRDFAIVLPLKSRKICIFPRFDASLAFPHAQPP